MALAINKISDYYSRLNFGSDGSLSNSLKTREDKSFGNAVKPQENEHVDPAAAEAQSNDAETIAKISDNGRKDYFYTNYNDVVAQNFGLIFDVKV